MTVTVTKTVGTDTHAAGLEIDNDPFGVLTVYAGPAQPIAKYSQGSWVSAVIS